MADPSIYKEAPATTSLERAEAWFRREAVTKGGAECPCCRGVQKGPGRKVTPMQAAILVLLYHSYDVGAEVDIEQFVAALNDPELKAAGMGRVVHWDLLEPTENKNVFRMCEGGHYFIHKGHLITPTAWILNDVVIGRGGKPIGLAKVLGTKFDLNSLLQTKVDPNVLQAIKAPA